MLVLFVQVFIFAFERALEFQGSLEKTGLSDFIIWGINTWFMIRITLFLSSGAMGYGNRITFKRNRTKLLKNKMGFTPKHIDVLQFSYDLPIEVLYVSVNSVLRALAAANADGITATYVILVTNEGKKGKMDVRVIEKIAKRYSSAGLHIIIQYQEDGKRDAFGKGFEILKNDPLSKRYPPEVVGLVAFDGDVSIPKELWGDFFVEMFISLSRTMKIGATTIHNYAKVDSMSPWLIRMYSLRFLRRFYTMSATANVLTGRCSAFLGNISRDARFQKILVNDLINHRTRAGIFHGNPLLLPFRLVPRIVSSFIPKKVFETMTGDDKSTIYHVLKEGYNVVFNPLLYVICHEDLPQKFKRLPNVWFLQLPAFAIRYCRNTMNNHPRLMELGMKRLGFVRYVSLLSDRYFFWTPLVGLMALPFLMISQGFGYIYVYFAWVMASRTLMTLIICISANRLWSAFYPVILYNEHTALVLVKIWSVVSAISSWTRQEIKALNPERFSEIIVFTTILSAMFIIVGVFSGVLHMPSMQEFIVTIQLIRE